VVSLAALACPRSRSPGRCGRRKAKRIVSAVPVIPLWVHVLELVAVPLLALRLGDRDAKLAAIGYSIYNLSIILIYYLNGKQFLGPTFNTIWGLIEVGCFATLMFRSSRAWPIVTCAIALLELATTIAGAVSSVLPWALGTAEIFWYYLMLICIVLATVRSPSARAKVAAARRPHLSPSTPG
jgi:hypothetical protein